MPRIQRFLLTMLMFAMLLIAAISVILLQMRPLIYKMAKTAVTDVVGTEINQVIQDETLDGSFDYTKLVTLEKDNNGNITALITNAALINTLQTKISNGVFKKVSNEIFNEIKIPMGNAVGGLLFSGRGPSFTVRIMSVADVDTAFSNSFESAGVNQTRHKIYLDILCDIDIMVPGYSTETLKVKTQTCIAETVIVGKVPNIYANLPNLDTTGESVAATGDTP
jgi:sporulation protein YunB